LSNSSSIKKASKKKRMSYDVEEEEKMSKDYGDELSGISEGQKNITW